MRFQNKIRQCLTAAAALATIVGAGSALADEFPEKPIRIINAFAPGGATDTAIRGLTANSDTVIDQPIVIESVTGGGGVTGILKAAQSDPDGYTLLVADTVMATLPLFEANLPVGMDDFKPVGVFNLRGAWLLTRPSKGWNTVDDVVAAAKADPGGLTIGVPSLNSPQHLAIVALEEAYDIQLNTIPYGGGAPTMGALLGDQIDVAMPGAPAGLDSVNAGEAVFLAASTDIELLKFEGEIISYGDLGLPYDIGIWTALWAPKDTPDDVMESLVEIFGTMATSDAWTEFARGYGVTPIWKPGAEAAEYIATSSGSLSSLAALLK